MTALLRGAQLYKAFVEGGQMLEVLRGADVELLPGSLTALTGPSGSGKSVLLDLLAGWSPPDAGCVLWADATVPPGWAGLGLVPQAMALLPDLTVWHNVGLPVRIAHGAGGLRAAAGRVASLLDRLEVGHLRDRMPDELSFGEQQRVALARAVVLEPPLVLADEPTSHQDDDSAGAVLRVLRAVCERGGAVLLTSHDDDVVTQADAVLRVVDGRLERVEPLRR